MMSVSYLHLPTGGPIPSSDPRTPFRAVIVVEQDVDAEWRDRVSTWLVRTGCLYMMAWGQDCDAWDDSVDWAYLSAWDFKDATEDRSITTTWHNLETLAETFRFAQQGAFHPTVPLPDVLILHVAPEARRGELLALWQATLDADPPETT